MLNVILKSLLVVILSAIVLAGGWYLFPEIKWRRNLNWLMYSMAEDAGVVVAESLPRDLNVNKVLIMPVNRDSDEAWRLAEVIGDAVDRAQKFHVVTWENAQATGGDDFVALFPVRPADVATGLKASQWLNSKRNLGIHALLNLELHQFTDGQEFGKPAWLKLSTRLVKVTDGQVVGSPVSYDVQLSGWSPSVLGFRIKSTSVILRFLMWIVLTVAMPWAAWGSGLAESVFKRHSNVANLLLLGTMTLISCLAAWLLLGLMLSGFGVFCLLVATAVAGYWNFGSMNALENRF